MNALPVLPPRNPDSHKGDYGRALLIGGSVGMSGAISLSGMAALRSGAGLVRLAVPDVCVATVASFEASYMTSPLPADQEGRIDVAAKEQLDALSRTANCVACGPGLGKSAGLERLVRHLYATLPQPLVLDADGLNALSAARDRWPAPGGARILTPHPGEFRRLAGDDAMSADKARERAVEMAAHHGLVVVLKGHRTFITDGRRQEINTTGNPGMATGGTGDVLTGIISGLVCQGLSPFDAAQLGVYVHGLAGDLATAALGQVSMVASDLVRYLPQAFLQYARRPTP